MFKSFFPRNVQVLAAVGRQEAGDRFHRLLACLSHPPSYTCVRANTHVASVEEIRRKLGEELRKVGGEQRCSHVWGWPPAAPRPPTLFWLWSVLCWLFLKQQHVCSSSAEGVAHQILLHPRIPDVLLLPVHGPRYVRSSVTDLCSVE